MVYVHLFTIYVIVCNVHWFMIYAIIHNKFSVYVDMNNIEHYSLMQPEILEHIFIKTFWTCFNMFLNTCTSMLIFQV
jgi:hypothetical protein